MDIFEAEQHWGEALRGQSLVIQVEYDDELARKALRRIGYLIQRGDLYVVETAHMASLLIGLNLIASAELEQGALWMKIMSALNDLENSPSNQQKITRLHRLGLKRFGLQRFEHPLGRIGEIILHSGIPVHSQKSFIQKLIREYRTVPFFDAAHFCAEVRAIPRERAQSRGLDAPTWHFINQAGDVAEDFVAKCIEVLDDLQDDGILNSGGGQGLPQRIIDEIERVVGDLGSLKRLKGSARVANPRIRWQDDEIQVVLPVMPENSNSDTLWQIDTASHQTPIQIPRTMPGLAASQENFAIHEISPTLAIQATMYSSLQGRHSTRSWNLKLFEESSPVLIFRSDGSLDSSKGPAEPALHRVVMPQTYKGNVSRIEIDGIGQARQIDTPFGWGSGEGQANWVAFEVDLEGADLLAIYVGDTQRPAVKRSISAFRKPKIFKSSPVPGVFDLSGNPVHSSLPIVSVPPSETFADVWVYRVTDLSNGSLLEDSVRPEKGLVIPNFEQPIDGNFEISVSRGLGTGLKFNTNVVSGLTTSNSSLRLLDDNGNGLVQFNTVLARNGNSKAFSLGINQFETQVEDARLSIQPLVLSPRHESFELLNKKSLRNTSWVTPIKAHLEDLTDLQLYATLGEQGSTDLVAQSPDNTIVRLLAKEFSPRLRFDLSELAETANQKGSLTLKLVTSGARKISLGQVYPRKLFVDAAFDPENRTLQFTFQTKEAPSGLAICFYTPLAPWVAPVVVSIEGDKISVPESVHGFGKIFFTVDIENPWVTSAFSPTPNLKNPNTSSVDDGPIDPNLSADHALAYWLKTGQKMPLLDSMSIGRAWKCMLTSNVQTNQVVSLSAVRDLASRVLNMNPVESLAHYPQESGVGEHYLKHLFSSGLVAAESIDSYRGVAEFSGKPVLACILTSVKNSNQFDSLVSLATDFWGLKSTTLDFDERVQDSLVQTLLSKSKLFGQLPMIFDHYDDTSLENWYANYVPGALFESGTMAKIARDLAIDAEKAHAVIHTPSVRDAIDELDGESSLNEMEVLALANTRPFASHELRESVRRNRGLRIATFDLPAISIRLAILVRLGARGDQNKLSTWRSHMQLHKQISTVSPALVELDLTTAELYLKLKESATNGQHKSDSGFNRNFEHLRALS